MSFVFAQLLGCPISTKRATNVFRNPSRFASSIRSAAKESGNFSIQISSSKEGIWRHRSGANFSQTPFHLRSSSTTSSGVWRQQAPPSRRAFSSTFFSRGPRNAIGRIEPKRIVVEIPRINPFESVWKPILFATGLSVTAYVLAAAYTNRETDIWSERLGSNSWWRRGTDQPTDDEIQRAKKLQTAKRLQDTLDRLPSALSFLPEGIKTPLLRIYISLSESYLMAPPAQLVCLSIIGLNGLVFLAWKIPRLEPMMRRFWMHWPVGSNHRVVTLATAIFSHQSLPHFAFNSLALYSFGSAAYSYLAHPDRDYDSLSTILPSSTTSYHFLAFFLTAGLFSSLSSHLATVLIRVPRLLRDLASPARVSSISALAANQAVLPSLGASGAIYATLTLTALAFPDASVSLIFVPWFPIPIGAGMVGMIAIDALGMIRGWKMFDHVAHLAGALFGLAYYQVGPSIWTWLRVKLGAEERRLGL